jgi:hypothetical protein
VIKPILADRFYVVGFFQGRRYPEELRCPRDEIDDYLATHKAYILGEGEGLAEAQAEAKKSSVQADWYQGPGPIPMPNSNSQQNCRRIVR